MINSPTTWGHQQRINALGPASASPYFSIALYAAGNVLAVAILILCWYSWGILAAFQEPLLWAWLCSLSLRDVKRFLVSTARSELHRSSFVVCCAKLVFLPAVVAWQVIEEVRDKLAAKYQELQLDSQHQAAAAGAAADHHDTAGAAAAAAAEQQDTAPASSSCAAAGEPCCEEGGPAGGSAQPRAAEHAGRRVDEQQAAASSKGSKGSSQQQILRQRTNTASKGQQQQQQQQQSQQQQQQKSQRPPLGPRPAAAAAAVNGTATATAASAASAAARKHGGGRKGAAASGASKGSPQHLGRGQAAPTPAGRKAQAGPAAASPFQQRVARAQDVVRQLFSGYGFIIGELLRFILGGLLPRRASSLATAATVAEQQQRQQQQQLQQQQRRTWPAAVASTNGTLTAASLPPPIGGVVGVSGVGAAVGVQQLHAGAGTHQLPQYLDLSSCSNSSSYPTTVAGSRADSFNGSSCRSECNMPWTPHPHWAALLQQQQQQHQHHQQQLIHQQQHQQQSQGMRHQRLSSSSSTPSLQATAAASVSQHASPRGGGLSTTALLAGVCETGPLGLAAAVGAHLERHMTLPADGPHGTSFAGWAGAPQQQQQGAQQLMSGGADAICGQAAVAGVLGADAAAAEHVHGGDSTQGGSCDSTGTSTAGGQRFSRAASALSLSSLPAAAAAPAHAGGAASVLYQGPGLPHSELSTPFLTPPVSALSGFGIGADGWQPSTSWDGLLGGGGGGRTPPGSVTGMAAGSSGSSPSAVLFKGLLRGIVLFEGYRFVRGFMTAEQSLFIPLLVLAATLAVAGGLPFLLLPSSLLKPHAATADGAADSKPKSAATAANSSRRRMRSPFLDAAGIGAGAGSAHTSTGGKGSKHASSDAAGILPSSASSMLLRLWVCLQQSYAVVWSRAVSVCVKADTALRTACASSFLDTAVSGLIVVGLILGSVVLGAVLLVQVGDESRQAVVSVNSLVRHKSTQAGLTEGVWSLVQQYEGQLVGMTQYVLQETLPGLTLYVETRASDFLISHNLSKVLIDWELVRAALKLPADCGDEAKLRLAVQLANSSLAESQLSTEKHALQQQLDQQQQRLHVLAAQLEGLWLNGSSTSSSGGNGSGGGGNGSSSSISTNSTALAHEVLKVQAAVESLQEKLHSAVAGHEAASEQLKLAELRMHNCQPTNTTSAGAAAAVSAGFAAGAAQGRGLLSSLLGGFTASSKNASDAAAGGAAGIGAAGLQDSGMRAGAQGMGVMANPASHVRGVLIALAKFDFATAGAEVASMLGQLMPEEEDHAPQQQQQQRPQKQVDEAVLLQQQQQQQSLRQLHADGTCELLEQQQQEEDAWVSSAATDLQQHQGPLSQLPLAPISISHTHGPQCSSNTTCGPVPPPPASSPSSSSGVDAAKAPGLTAVAQQGSSTSSSTSSSSSTGTSLVRVARGAAYPLITMLRHLSGLVVAGMGSGAAVTLGAGLGVLRLGLGVAKFLVQLGVFASVLYTLLALDIDPVEQLVKLLPISEASQERASRAVTKALRGVFVSSLKLAAFHAGFTWLTLRAFGTHFVCTATVASAIVAVLPLVPVYLTALPGVLELVLARGAPVKGLVLLALHVGAYTFGDDLIYREIDPQLPYLVGLGVFGGMWHFANPLQGVLLGPMVLALLSVGYNLHREMY